MSSPQPVPDPRRYQLFIDGQFVDAESGKTFKSPNPSTGETFAEVAAADKADVDKAVAAARKAMTGKWSKMSARDRGRLLYKLSQLIERDAAQLAELETRDNGKPIKESTYIDLPGVVENFEYFAGWPTKIEGETIPVPGQMFNYTLREPVGVCGQIIPWNFPLLMAAWKLAPALAAGNAVVLKPAEQTPVTAMELAKLIDEAGFPAGAVNVVPGYGGVAGAALAGHPDVNKISFTGSHATARRIMQAAAANLKRLTFECGGKSPHIIFADADIERALIVATQSAFRSTGQSCSLGSRLFVQRPLYGEFVDRIADRARRIRIGPPLDPRSHIGPQTSAEQLAKTESYIALGKSEGARLVVGGGRPKALDRGYYIEPTVFAGMDNRSRVAQEEIFGPVLAVMPFDTEEEAIRLANEVEYGLVAGLWTSDVSRAHRVSAALEAGLVTVNTFRTTHPMLPYGGYKLSGLGRENGMEAIHHYTEVKTV